MRVTHIITRLIIGGAQENTVASVLGLRSSYGHDVRLISGIPGSGVEGSLESSFDNAPGVLQIVPELTRPVQPWKDSLALWRLTGLLRRDKPDVVHTHSGKAGILGRLAGQRAGVPVIIHTIHGPSFGDWQGAMANFVFRTAEKAAANATDHFVVVAQAMRDQYLAAGIGKSSQYTRILSGFNIQPFLQSKNSPELRKRLGIGTDDIVIGKVARLFALKGHEDLLKVAPAIVQQEPRVKFLFVGDGSWRDRLQAEARARGVDSHIVFAGLLPPAQVPEYIGMMDMLVHLSVREGLPRALPQALAAGKPVIAYDCDGAREVCRDGETGFLVRGRDTDALQDRILRLARDMDLRQKLGATGQALVQKEFPVEKMVTALHELYVRLAQAKGIKAG